MSLLTQGLASFSKQRFRFTTMLKISYSHSCWALTFLILNGSDDLSSTRKAKHSIHNDWSTTVRLHTTSSGWALRLWWKAQLVSSSEPGAPLTSERRCNPIHCRLTITSAILSWCFRTTLTNLRVSTRFWWRTTGIKPSITENGTYYQIHTIGVVMDHYEWWRTMTTTTPPVTFSSEMLIGTKCSESFSSIPRMSVEISGCSSHLNNRRIFNTIHTFHEVSIPGMANQPTRR